MRVLLISPNADVRQSMALAVRSVERSLGEPLEFLEAVDGLEGIALAWRYLPDVVVADEIASRAGAFAVARELKGAAPPFPGRVVIVLDRPQDEWLASWSGADAWFVKPLNPFEMADTVGRFVGTSKEAV
jgi:DNA-binding response OmpR family regulator